MSRRSTVESFPPIVRQLVQRKLYENGFKDYIALAAELTAAGHSISKSALHRFGAKLQESVKQADVQALHQSPLRPKQVTK